MDITMLSHNVVYKYGVKARMQAIINEIYANQVLVEKNKQKVNYAVGGNFCDVLDGRRDVCIRNSVHVGANVLQSLKLDSMNLEMVMSPHPLFPYRVH